MRIKRIALVLALLLAALPTAALAATDTPCSLTVTAGDAELAADYAAAQVVVDLYRVARPETLPTASTDVYTLLAPFTALSLDVEETDTALRALANEAARIARTDGVPAVSGAALDERIDRDDGGAALLPGLYLLMARGADIDDPVAVHDGDLDTIARTAVYEYAFAPQLIVLPNATDEGFQYDMTVTLKSAHERRTGALEIVKLLPRYEDAEAATFVFEIEARLQGELVYSDVAALTFTAPGERVARIDGLPVEAEVTVTEVYSGARYALTTAATQSAVIEAENSARVSFTNDYDESGRGGHGIVNHFEYRDANGWDNWTQLSDNAAG